VGAVRVGVISTHQPVAEDAGAGWLPGAYRGGAELSDAEYFAHAPDGVEWAYITPDEAHTVDRVLVTSLEGLSEDEGRALANFDPVVFLHHATRPEAWKARLIEGARRLIVHTPAHLSVTRAWSSPHEVVLVLSAMDESELYPAAVKEPFALAACRDHPLKGLANARIRAAREGYPLVVMTREERRAVIDSMRRAEVFIHLPLEFESEGRAVIEAVLCGCRVLTNAHVGVTSVPGWDDPDVLRGLVAEAPSVYWDAVCR
jgi:hypothetical protein